jgi:hypothetical protein
MDATFDKELDRQKLMALVLELRAENARLRKRIEELEARFPTTRLDEFYSQQAEERRRAQAAATKMPTEITAPGPPQDAGQTRSGRAERSRLAGRLCVQRMRTVPYI